MHAADIPFLIGGAYVVEVYAGVSRSTKDFDLYVRPKHVKAALRALARAGYEHVLAPDPGELDLTDARQADDFFAEERPEYVFIAAGKSGGSLNMISTVWLAGNPWSVLRRSDQVMASLRSGISTSARTASSGERPGPGDIVSVRQIAEPTKRLPCGSAGSSS